MIFPLAEMQNIPHAAQKYFGWADPLAGAQYVDLRADWRHHATVTLLPEIQGSSKAEW